MKLTSKIHMKPYKTLKNAKHPLDEQVALLVGQRWRTRAYVRTLPAGYHSVVVREHFSAPHWLISGKTAYHRHADKSHASQGKAPCNSRHFNAKL